MTSPAPRGAGGGSADGAWFAADARSTDADSSGGGAAPKRRSQRILNETDVYIKYKLYAKAIEHLQRVFERNPRHVEAREKLKALYLTVGKKDEAVLELWALVEQRGAGTQAALPARDPRARSDAMRARPASSARSCRRRCVEDSTSGIDEIDMAPRWARSATADPAPARCSTSRISRSWPTTSSTSPSRRTDAGGAAAGGYLEDD